MKAQTKNTNSSDRKVRDLKFDPTDCRWYDATGEKGAIRQYRSYDRKGRQIWVTIPTK